MKNSNKVPTFHTDVYVQSIYAKEDFYSLLREQVMSELLKTPSAQKINTVKSSSCS